ncbi:MAG: hypothetical protein JXN10_00330 [Clostridia bacterium]|nr:hypothetical protein [Clostridia bacterium]MBN2881945.1 hypothetical protein [Clostridia bacterium]
MKRIIFLTLALFILFGSVSVFAFDSYYPDYEIKATDEFLAIGLPITNISNPIDKLQSMKDFDYVHGQKIYEKYVLADYASIEKSDYTTSYRFDESYFSHEEKPHLPGVYKQGDVAAGVGITTAGIVIVNALTNTSLFGSAPFNGSFNPQASPGVQPGTGSGAGSASGSTGSATTTGISGTSSGISSAASTAQGSAASSLSQGAQASAGGSNLLKGISDFFKGLFEVLRDMLTDEGRSYASGKLTDILSEKDFTDFVDKE